MTQPKTKLRASPRPLPQGALPAARHDADARAAAARVARESYGKLVAYLAAPARDVPGAEDALADAFAAALAVWPSEGRAVQSRRLAGEDGAAPADRRRAPAPQRRSGFGRAGADRRGAEGGGGRAAIDPRPASGADVRLRSSGDRRVHSRALDAADDSGSRRGGDRFGLPGLARRDGPAPHAAPKRRSGSPACRSRSPSARICPTGSGWRWRRFTLLFHMAGRKPSRTIRAGATSPRRRFGSAASSSGSRRTSPKRWASWR